MELKTNSNMAHHPLKLSQKNQHANKNESNSGDPFYPDKRNIVSDDAANNYANR